MDKAPTKRIRPIANFRGDRVYETLKRNFIEGRTSLGQRLYESTVAAQCDASRTPVREALMRLKADGLIDRVGRAYAVREFTMEMVGQLYQAREALECRALEIALDGGRTLDLSGAEAAIGEMDRALAEGSSINFNYADIRFHREIAKLSGNEFLRNMLESIYDKVLMVRNYLFSQRPRQTTSLKEHQRILDAVQRGNSVIAVAEMQSHLRSVIQLMAEYEAQGPGARERSGDRIQAKAGAE